MSLASEGDEVRLRRPELIQIR